MQKAIKVDSDSKVRELNELFEDGWIVVDSCPMPSSGDLSHSQTFSDCFEYSYRKERLI